MLTAWLTDGRQENDPLSSPELDVASRRDELSLFAGRDHDRPRWPGNLT